MAAKSTLTLDANNKPISLPTGLTLTSGDAVVSTITNAALATNVATITVALPHGYIVGQNVTIALDSGHAHYATFSFLNGTYAIVATPTATTFTFSKTHGDVVTDTITGSATESLASPIVTDTTDLTLTAPDNAVSINIYLPDNPAKMKIGSNTFTMPKTTWLKYYVKAGATIVIGRSSTTAVEFYYDTI